jgi:chromosome segregation ATPase
MRLSTVIAFAVALLFPAIALGQAAGADSQTLQALLAEVRQLREDLRISTVTSQRAQILIYRAQAQETVVQRLTQRLEETKTRITQLDAEQKRAAAQIKQLEDMKVANDNPIERKQLEDVISHTKERLDESVSEAQESQAKATDLEEQLRTEQAKLGRLQDDLDRLDKSLETSSQRPAAKLQ